MASLLGQRSGQRMDRVGQSLWRAWENPALPHLVRTISQAYNFGSNTHTNTHAQACLLCRSLFPWGSRPRFFIAHQAFPICFYRGPSIMGPPQSSPNFLAFFGLPETRHIKSVITATVPLQSSSAPPISVPPFCLMKASRLGGRSEWSPSWRNEKRLEQYICCQWQ